MTHALARRSRGWIHISAAATMVMLVVGVSGSSSSSSAATTSGGGSGAPGRGAARVEVPVSIDPTGHADVTEALQQFLSTVPDGSTVEFRPQGRYRVDGTLLVEDRHDLTFDGSGATIFAVSRGDTSRSQWRVRDSSEITFRNMNVRGANARGGVNRGAYVPKLAQQHGIRFEGVDGAEVHGVTVSNVYGDFVYVGLDARQVGSRNVWIHDSTFRANGRQGIAVTAASGVIIEHNTFTGTARSTIDLEPTGHRWRVDHVFVLNNTVGPGRLLFVAAHGQGPVDDIVISGNHLHGHTLTIDVMPPANHRRTNWIITDNTSDTTDSSARTAPLRFGSIDGLEIRHNHQQVVGGAPGLVLSNVCGDQVSANDFGLGGIRRSGKQCNAQLTVPQPPAIPGRPANASNPAALDSSHPEQDWTTVVAVLGALIATLAVAIVDRRRRHRPVSPDLPL